jgi:outer membrane protein
VTSVGVRLELPLYQGGLVNSQVREAVENLEKARAEMEDAQREVTLQAAQIFYAITSSVERIHAL